MHIHILGAYTFRTLVYKPVYQKNDLLNRVTASGDVLT